MQFLPVISSIRLNKTNVQVGTPEIDVTTSLIVLFASFSILLSHSSISAMLRSGVLIQCPQKGEFCNNTALRSPVSYTHLRAHETGRNLVCRLLLEKKKTA